MKTVYLGFGSNMGDKHATIEKALVLLGEHGTVTAVSPFYETEPFGIVDQEMFLNGVCAFETDLSPHALLDRILHIEEQLGRVRTVKNGPRTIDIDVLLYGDQVITDERLHIPHPGMLTRWCVLQPLVDIAPHVQHPVVQKTATQLRDALTDAIAVGKLKK